MQGESLVAGVAAGTIFGDLFDQWNRQNLSPMFSRVYSKTDATVDRSVVSGDPPSDAQP